MSTDNAVHLNNNKYSQHFPVGTYLFNANIGITKTMGEISLIPLLLTLYRFYTSFCCFNCSF